MMKRAAMLAALVTTGCVTGDRVRSDVDIGMTKAEVIQVLGRPDGVRAAGNSEVLQYTNRIISGWSWDKADYSIVLTDGVVTEYGTGEVRQAPAAQGGVFFIVR